MYTALSNTLCQGPACSPDSQAVQPVYLHKPQREGRTGYGAPNAHNLGIMSSAKCSAPDLASQGPSSRGPGVPIEWGH